MILYMGKLAKLEWLLTSSATSVGYRVDQWIYSDLHEGHECPDKRIWMTNKLTT